MGLIIGVVLILWLFGSKKHMWWNAILLFLMFNVFVVMMMQSPTLN